MTSEKSSKNIPFFSWSFGLSIITSFLNIVLSPSDLIPAARDLLFLNTPKSPSCAQLVTNIIDDAWNYILSIISTTLSFSILDYHLEFNFNKFLQSLTEFLSILRTRLLLRLLHELHNSLPDDVRQSFQISIINTSDATTGNDTSDSETLASSSHQLSHSHSTSSPRIPPPGTPAILLPDPNELSSHSSSFTSYLTSPKTPKTPLTPVTAYLTPIAPHTPSTPLGEGVTLVNDSPYLTASGSGLRSSISSSSTSPLPTLPQTVSPLKVNKGKGVQSNNHTGPQPLTTIHNISIPTKPKPKVLPSESNFKLDVIPKIITTATATATATATENANDKENERCQTKDKEGNRYYRKDTFMRSLNMDMIPIGEGGFGQVFRATGKGGKQFAVKLMQRGVVTQEVAIVNEVTALQASRGSDWAVNMIYFQAVEEQALLALTYVPGGDMHTYWEKSGFMLSYETARFYTAQLILAIHDLHTRGIIHRDIKLENMMLDHHLNLKLVDFGLAQVFDHDSVSVEEYPLFHQMKQLGGDAFPLLWATSHNPHQTDLANGTEGYAPPEVWKCVLHSFGIDYFAMGCVLHMLLTGNAPFRFDQVTQDYYYEDVVVDQNMPSEAFDFLSKVLSLRPINRPNVRRMKLHGMFAGMDWNALAKKQVTPPDYPRPSMEHIADQRDKTL